MYRSSETVTIHGEFKEVLVDLFDVLSQLIFDSEANYKHLAV
jgi:hypothetical protein